MSKYRVGADIGGTFTDIVFLDSDGRLHTKKISSNVSDYAKAIIDGIEQVFSDTGLTAEDVTEILHGTTVASNAILELKGARTGLITTKGFRDVLEIRNLRMPRLYDLAWEKPPTLVERYLRLVVDERINVRGEIRHPLDVTEAESVVDQLLDEGVEAIAICLLNSFANPRHEHQIRDIVKSRAPNMLCCISHDVLPEIKEYERTSTTVINTYVLPIVARYLSSLRQGLDDKSISAPLWLMQSNGGLTTSRDASERPMNIIESGPAGGVIGAQALGKHLGLSDIITFDMGGTTAKASLIENNEVTRSQEYQVGGGIMMGSRLLTGAGYMLKVPAIDLAEVGAGGGSIVSIDAGGSLQVGPESAGAEPGPLCYDIGGTQPTVTDANVILGYINPDYLVGGAVKLNPDKAKSVFNDSIAGPMNLSLEHAAYGAYQIAASNMMRAIKAVSTERGRDPRNYTLFAFGGNGPVFASAMADALQMKSIVVPPSPGLFSSFGLLYADVEHHYSRTFRQLVRSLDVTQLKNYWDELTQQAADQLESDGFPLEQINIRRSASMHYQGQTYELRVDVPDQLLTGDIHHNLEEAFGVEHERTYGHRAGIEEPVEIVNLYVVGYIVSTESRVPEYLQGAPSSKLKENTRSAYFGTTLGWIDTAIVDRSSLSEKRTGPLIVEEYDATVVVPPNAAATLDDYGNIRIELG